jgi:hypothetical protein
MQLHSYGVLFQSERCAITLDVPEKAINQESRLDPGCSVRVIVFLGLIASAWANETLDVLVNAAASFSATIKQQLEMIQSNPSPAELVEKTIDYADAKAAYFRALRAELPALKNVADGERSPDLDTFAAALAVAGEEQQKVADAETLVLLKRYPHNPDVARAMLTFQHAQAVERQFHQDYDGLDLKDH